MRRFTRRIRCLDANGNITADYFQHETWVLVPAAGWVFAADLGPTHGQWSVLMEWTGIGEPS